MGWLGLLLMLQAVVWSRESANCSWYNEDGYDSSLEDDSDYQSDGSGSYTTGDDLGLKVHANNEWDVRVSWNSSKYQAPHEGWNYKVLFAVNTTYQTTFGVKQFTSSSEETTRANHVTFPLYNPTATYTITVLAGSTSEHCLGERIVINDLPGREDAIAHFQIRLKFYTYRSCQRKIRKKDRVLSNFNLQLFDALRNKRFRDVYNISLNLSQYSLTDLDLMCQDKDIAMITGRLVATGSTPNVELMTVLEKWVRSKPTLLINRDRVLVDTLCPVYYVPAVGEYCISNNSSPKHVNETDIDTNNHHQKSPGYHGSVIAAMVIGVVLLVTLSVIAVVLMITCRKKKGNFRRFSNLSFRSEESRSRRLRIDNVLAEIENVDCSCNRSASYSPNDSKDLSHGTSKRT